ANENRSVLWEYDPNPLSLNRFPNLVNIVCIEFEKGIISKGIGISEKVTFIALLFIKTSSFVNSNVFTSKNITIATPKELKAILEPVKKRTKTNVASPAKENIFLILKTFVLNRYSIIITIAPNAAALPKPIELVPSTPNLIRLPTSEDVK